MTKINYYRKACNCKGTSSGPRVITESRLEPEKDTYDSGEEVTLTYICKEVVIACDECDKEWNKQKVDV